MIDCRGIALKTSSASRANYADSGKQRGNRDQQAEFMAAKPREEMPQYAALVHC